MKQRWVRLYRTVPHDGAPERVVHGWRDQTPSPTRWGGRLMDEKTPAGRGASRIATTKQPGRRYGPAPRLDVIAAAMGRTGRRLDPWQRAVVRRELRNTDARREATGG